MSGASIAALVVAGLFAWMFGVLGAQHHHAKPCTHGASSAYAWVDAQGKTHVSKPSTSGCIPGRR